MNAPLQADPEEVAARLFDALGGSRTPTGYLLHCPAHDDRRPSLSVTPAADRVLLHCFARCDYGDIVAALQRQGLWHEPTPGGSVAPRPARQEAAPPHRASG